MSQLPINPLSPEEQQKIMGQMYLIMGKQVQSYHKHRHMGENSSIPVELAQDLMQSITYTINLVGGVYTHKKLGEALALGQEILESRLSKAKSMLELVNATAPSWQTECRWEALRYLQYYLEHYDHHHLAHKDPDDLFYPILISTPEGIQGIDSCIFHLNILWLENQIMASFEDDALESLWCRLPAEALNQCEYLMINAIGKVIQNGSITTLTFEEEERQALYHTLAKQSTSQLRHTVKAASTRLCEIRTLSDPNVAEYIHATAMQLPLRLEGALTNNCLSAIFL